MLQLTLCSECRVSNFSSEKEHNKEYNCARLKVRLEFSFNVKKHCILLSKLLVDGTLVAKKQ